MKAPVIILIAALAGILVGCGKKDQTFIPKNTKEAATHMENVFQGGSTTAQGSVSEFQKAVQTQNYEKAVVALGEFNKEETMTYQQAIAVKNSTKALQMELAGRIDTDPNARRAWEMLKAAARD